jgi:LmbE family N-acetylglucosaminyl deacetylase
MPEILPHIAAPWLTFSNYRGKTALVAQAHPDDADFGCGGTAAHLAAAGANVVYVVATNGEAGTRDPEMTKERLTEIRRGEQRDANGILGVSDTIFLGHEDGRLRRVPALEEQLISIFRKYRPAVVFTFDPEWPEHFMHPDHRAVAIATMRAAQFSNLSLTYTGDEPAEPFECGEILLFGPKRPNVWVNVSKYAFAKLEALAAHRSQMEHMLPPWLHSIMYRLVERGDRLESRIIPSLMHSSFVIEPFRRCNGTGLMY